MNAKMRENPKGWHMYAYPTVNFFFFHADKEGWHEEECEALCAHHVIQITSTRRRMELLRLIVLDGSYEADELTFTSPCAAKASARLTPQLMLFIRCSVMEFSLQRSSLRRFWWLEFIMVVLLDRRKAQCV